jgi:hypothetical protein
MNHSDRDWLDEGTKKLSKASNHAHGLTDYNTKKVVQMILAILSYILNHLKEQRPSDE